MNKTILIKPKAPLGNIAISIAKYIKFAVSNNSLRKHISILLNRFKLDLNKMKLHLNKFVLIGVIECFSPVIQKEIWCEFISTCVINKPYNLTKNIKALEKFLQLKGVEHGCSTKSV